MDSLPTILLATTGSAIVIPVIWIGAVTFLGKRGSWGRLAPIYSTPSPAHVYRPAKAGNRSSNLNVDGGRLGNAIDTARGRVVHRAASAAARVEASTGIDIQWDRHYHRMVSGRLGFMSYDGVLTVGSTDTHLYISVASIFRPGHPPLWIPWDHLQYDGMFSDTIFGNRRVVLEIRHDSKKQSSGCDIGVGLPRIILPVQCLESKPDGVLTEIDRYLHHTSVV